MANKIYFPPESLYHLSVDNGIIWRMLYVDRDFKTLFINQKKAEIITFALKG